MTLAAAALAAACTSSPGTVANGRGIDASANGGSAGLPGDGGSTGGGGAGGAAVGGAAGAGGSLVCDSRFSVSPDPPGTGSLTSVGFTDSSPLTYIKLTASGPGTATLVSQGITTSNPWTWTWAVTDLTPGLWTFTFSAGSPQAPVATCQKNVLDTGTPPPAPPPPKGSCTGKVCGDDDGNGGKCTTCPMVGSCLSPASPYGPGGKGSWSCLDNAGCLQNSGLCKILVPVRALRHAEASKRLPEQHRGLLRAGQRHILRGGLQAVLRERAAELLLGQCLQSVSLPWRMRHPASLRTRESGVDRSARLGFSG